MVSIRTLNDKYGLGRFNSWYTKEINCKREFVSQYYKKINERPIELRFVFDTISKIYPKTVLDIGPGLSSLPHLISLCGCVVYSIDNVSDYWSIKLCNRHFYVINDDIRNPRLKKKFDLITCISTLEHVDKFDDAVDSMFNLLRKNGSIILSFPYNEKSFVNNIYKDPDAGFGRDWKWICRVFSRKEIDSWLKRNNGIIVDQEFWKVFSGKYWSFGDWLKPAQKVDIHSSHHLTCLWIKKRV